MPMYSCTHAFTLSLTYSFTLSLTHSFTLSLHGAQCIYVSAKTGLKTQALFKAIEP